MSKQQNYGAPDEALGAELFIRLYFTSAEIRNETKLARSIKRYLFRNETLLKALDDIRIVIIALSGSYNLL